MKWPLGDSGVVVDGGAGSSARPGGSAGRGLCPGGGRDAATALTGGWQGQCHTSRTYPALGAGIRTGEPRRGPWGDCERRRRGLSHRGGGLRPLLRGLPVPLPGLAWTGGFSVTPVQRAGDDVVGKLAVLPAGSACLRGAAPCPFFSVTPGTLGDRKLLDTGVTGFLAAEGAGPFSPEAAQQALSTDGISNAPV